MAKIFMLTAVNYARNLKINSDIWKGNGFSRARKGDLTMVGAFYYTGN